MTEKPVSDLTKLDEKKEETKPEIVESDKTEDTREPHETPCVTDAEGAYNAIYQAIVSYTTEVDLRQYHVDWNTFYKVCNQAIDDAMCSTRMVRIGISPSTPRARPITRLLA